MSGNLSRILTGLAFSLMPAGNALADVKITISFTEHEHVLTPPPEHDSNTKRTSTLFVSRDGKVRTEYSNLGWFFQMGADRLGGVHAGRNPAGLNQVGRIRIDRGRIVIATFLPSYKIVTHVTTDGKSTCSAQRTYELLPGHRLFEDKNASTLQDMTMSEIDTAKISCSIGEVGQ